MILFFINVLYYFLPLSIILGFLFFYYNKILNNQNGFFLKEIFFGIFLAYLINKITLTQTILKIDFLNNILFILLSFIIIYLILSKKNIKILYKTFVFIILFQATIKFLLAIKNHTISTTNIINTDFIINISLVLLASLLIIILSLINFKINSKINFKLLFIGLIISLSILITQTLAEIIFYLLKIDLIEMSSHILSFYAKTNYYKFIYMYIYLLIILINTIIFSIKSPKISKETLKLEPCIKRKFIKTKLVNNRYIKISFLSILTSFIILIYYDTVASKPISISKATILNFDKNGKIVIDTKNLKDGDLYRYAIINEDGLKIRFFLINRYPNRNKMTAVFDSCMICGDVGYIKEDNKVVCLACGVRIFVPSIGKAGGCNPIAMKYRIKNDKLIINKKTLNNGAKYFSQIVPIDVIDPISKEKFKNTLANYKYFYLNKTFYFKNEKNYEKFMKNPSKYIK